jgi:hypothetical protein
MKINKNHYVYAVLIVTFIIVCFVFWPFDKSPKYKMIESGFYVCDKCQSAEGGIYGKGPFKIFRSENAKWCIHNWRKVDKKEFIEFTFRVYKYDWSNEIPFWVKNN